MIIIRNIAISALLILAAVFTGCESTCPPAETIISRPQLVTEYNANAAAVPRLWARAKVKVSLKGLSWGSTSPLSPPNGLMLLAKGNDKQGPHDFLLKAGEMASIDLFRLGSNTEPGIYYLQYQLGEQGQAWWGWNHLAGAPGVDIPIDPNQLLEVLGIFELPDDFTKLPTVEVTMSCNPCAYVLTYLDTQPISGNIGFKREVYINWDTAKPRRPFMVNFFGPDGRRIMTAKLKDYKPIDTTGMDNPPASPPIMPTDIEIAWPEKKTSVHIMLSEMTTEEKWMREACQFKPGNLPQVHVDRALMDGGAAK